MSSYLPKRASLDIQFNDITYDIHNRWKKDKKTILKGVSGIFLPGQLSALLGPSGAGKTTLLNILSGFRSKQVGGEILVNKKPRCLKSFRKESCYIMQDDDHLQYLTVGESMHAAAFLKLGNNMSKSEKNNLIQEILSTLNIVGIQNTRIYNISGGELKRLSIALELVDNPPVMFLDEPTSGLDSLNSYHCINLLKKLATDGRTIVCTIHQPSARLFETFDYLLALADGQCIYRGTIPDLSSFMSSLDLYCPSYHNPADFLIEVASGYYGSYINQMTRAIGQSNDPPINSINGYKQIFIEPFVKEDSEEPINKEEIHNGINGGIKSDTTECEQTFLRNEEYVHKRANFCIQLYVLVIRNFRSIIRDPMFALIQLAAYVFAGINAGLIFFNIGNDANIIQSNIGYMMICLLFFNVSAVMTTVLIFPLEMKVYVREYFNNWYSLQALYLARTLTDIPFQTMLTLIYLCLVYFMSNQPLEASRFFLMAFIFILTSLIAQSLGIAIGVALDAQKALYVGAVILIPNVLYSGFFATFSSIPSYVRWLTYVSFVRYEYEGIMRITYGLGRDELHCPGPFCMFKHPKKILEQFEIEEEGLWIDLLVLCVYFILIRSLGYIILRLKLRKER